MKFFVDTADTAEIKSLAATGLLDGVTTNPTLVHRAGYPVSLKTYRFLVDQAGEKRISEIMLQAAHPDPGEVRAWLDELLPAAAINRTKQWAAGSSW